MAEQNETVEIPLLLENVLRYSLNDARARMEKGESIVPFTALAVGETLFMEAHEGDTVQDCFDSARRTVGRATGAKAYGFCYDGYVDLETGRADALIAQGGMPGEPYGVAIGLIYKIDGEGKPKFHSEPTFVGPCQNYMLDMHPFDDDDEVEDEEEETAEADE